MDATVGDAIGSSFPKISTLYYCILAIILKSPYLFKKKKKKKHKWRKTGIFYCQRICYTVKAPNNENSLLWKTAIYKNNWHFNISLLGALIAESINLMIYDILFV